MKLDEIWRDIPGLTGFYQASNMGRIKSIDRPITSSDGRCWFQPGKLLTPDDGHKGGYLTVMISINGKASRKLIHRLVASAFIENPQMLPEVNHINGNKKFNAPENLEWSSRSNNIDHAVSLELINNKGEMNPRAKLTKETVLKIRAMWSSGASLSEIASRTGATKRNAKNIVSRVSWKHLPDAI